jgi:ABC-2 type transport system permease protein
VDLTTVIFTLFAFGWLILPLLAFGLDSTLDPATLALYPLRTRPLAVGLLAASATGAWPLANVIGLLGVTVGLARGALGLLVAVLAVLLQVLFCITLARFVTTGLAGLLRSRRGKDLAAFLIIPIFACTRLRPGGAEGWPPTGKLTAPASRASTRGCAGCRRAWPRTRSRTPPPGTPGTALLRLACSPPSSSSLGWLWIRSLAAPWSPRTHHQYQRREPGAKIFWGLIVIIVAASCVSTLRTPAYQGGLIGAAAFGAAFIGIFNSDAIGMLGPAFGFEAVALHGRKSLRSYFAGMDFALVVVAVPLFTALLFVLAVVAKHPSGGFLALAVNLAGIGAGIGLSNILSVVSPYPVEKRAGSPTPKAMDGYRGQVLAATVCSLFGTGILLTPVILAVAFTGHVAATARMPVLLVIGAAYGLGLGALGVWLAARLAENRIPELAEVAVRSKV